MSSGIAYGLLGIAALHFVAELPILRDWKYFSDLQRSSGATFGKGEVYLLASLVLGILSEICAHLLDIRDCLTSNNKKWKVTE